MKSWIRIVYHGVSQQQLSLLTARLQVESAQSLNAVLTLSLTKDCIQRQARAHKRFCRSQSRIEQKARWIRMPLAPRLTRNPCARCHAHAATFMPTSSSHTACIIACLSIAHIEGLHRYYRGHTTAKKDVTPRAHRTTLAHARCGHSATPPPTALHSHPSCAPWLLHKCFA